MERLDIYPSHTKALPYMVHTSIDMRFSPRQRTYLVTTLCSNGLYLGQANMARLSSNGPVGGAAASCCDKQDFTDNFEYHHTQGFCVLPWSLTERAGCQGSWTDFSEDRPSAYSGHVRDTRSVEESAGHNLTKTLNLVHSTFVQG